jgi:hypothetical protein
MDNNDLLGPPNEVPSDPNYYGRHGHLTEGIVKRIVCKPDWPFSRTQVICRTKHDPYHDAVCRVKEVEDPEYWEHILKFVQAGDRLMVCLVAQERDYKDSYKAEIEPHRYQLEEFQKIWHSRSIAAARPQLELVPDPEPEPVAFQRCSFDVPAKEYEVFKAAYQRYKKEKGVKIHLTQGPDNYMCQVFVNLSKNPPFLP